MRILLVSSGNFKHRGERSHTFPQRIYNGLIRNGHHAYFLSDRDIAREGGVIGRLFGKNRVDNRFLETCKRFQPDLIMLGQADLLSTDALLEAKKILPHVKITAFCVDIVFSKHIEKTITDKIIALDSVFCTTAGEAIRKRFKRDGVSVAYIPNPCDMSIDYVRAEAKNTQEFDVFWAMRGYRNSWDGDPRFGIPRYLATQKDIKIDYYGFDNKPVLMGRNYYEAINNCKGGLNISVSRLNEIENHNPQDLYLYSSDRIGHYFGCGLLVYITRGFSLEELIPPDTHAIYFSTPEELADKIRYFSKNDSERQKIATLGANFYRTYFNEQTITDYMIDVTFNGKSNKNYPWDKGVY
jgi:spore maturation protein CgeB